MYVVFKSGRKVADGFTTYERARQVARKLARKLDLGYTFFSSNPNLGENKLEVRRV
jgi:hypothetical protein